MITMGYFDDMIREKENGKSQPDLPAKSEAGLAKPGVSTKTDFIPNPLPVPERKKHVEMDYDYTVSPEKMHFDIEDPKEDHFDIE